MKVPVRTRHFVSEVVQTIKQTQNSNSTRPFTYDRNVSKLDYGNEKKLTKLLIGGLKTDVQSETRPHHAKMASRAPAIVSVTTELPVRPARLTLSSAVGYEDGCDESDLV